MIEYIMISYAVMLLAVLIHDRTWVGFKIFIISPLVLPFFVIGVLCRVIVWSVT